MHTRHGQPRAPALTYREQEVISLIAAGCTNAAAATRLGLAPNTIKTHLQRIYRRLGIHCRTQAVVIAAARGELLPVRDLPELPDRPPRPHVPGVHPAAIHALAQRWEGLAPPQLLAELRGLNRGWATHPDTPTTERTHR